MDVESKSKALATEDTESTEKNMTGDHDLSSKRMVGMSALWKFSVDSVSSVAGF